MANDRHHTDQALLESLRHGDEGAFAEIYGRYWEVLFRHALRILQDEAQAQDAVQDVFMAVWQKHADLDSGGKLSAYLYKSLRNRIFDLLDRSKVKEAYLAKVAELGEGGAWSVDERIREKELTEAIERELDGMPAGMRLVFQLSRNEDLSYKEIAERLQISENTVKVQVSRALRILRRAFHIIFFI